MGICSQRCNPFHATERRHASHIRSGGVITLTLDLTDRGSLHARVGSSEEVCLFIDMLVDGEEKVDRSFVPAVSLTNPGKVRFLSFLTQSSHGEATTTTSSRE
jgi:hypothetical protein